MASRHKLHDEFVKILGTDERVYFQPPESLKMSYPAIRYTLNSIDNTFADDSVYKQENSYKVVVIDKNPDSEIAKIVSRLPRCRFNIFYAKDNLNHFVFNIVY